MLTSAENLKLIEEKLQEKQKEEELKAERKRQREEKQRLKQASKTSKKSCNKIKAAEKNQSGNTVAIASKYIHKHSYALLNP